jgi:hypothetical protein
MSRLRAQGWKSVSLGECQCPGTPHEEDVALFPESLDPFDAAEALSVIVGSGLSAEAIEAKVARIFTRRVTWNVVDEQGPVEFDASKVAWGTLMVIANAASEQYTEELFAPLASSPPTSSRGGQTGD